MSEKKNTHLQPRPITVYLREDSGSFDPALTTSFIKKENFKVNLKKREGDCLPNPNWEVVQFLNTWETPN